MSKIQLTLFSIGCATASLLNAQSTWTGDTSSQWLNSGNWSPATIPTEADAVIFDDPGAVANMPNTDDGGPQRDVLSATFNQAGWTISGGDRLALFGTGTPLSSSGAGVNRIDAPITVSSQAGPIDFYVNAGNTLVFGSSTAFGSGNPQINKTGAGTWVIDSGANLGFVQNSDINGGTLLINGAYQNNDFGHTLSINSGAVLGGTGSFSTTNRSNYDINSGGALNPGGDGTFGSQIGTLTFDNTRASGDRDTTITLRTGSTFIVDLDASTSDLLLLEKSVSNPDSIVVLDIETNVELALFGAPSTNTYNIVNVAGLDTVYNGSSFTSVTLNGLPLVDGVDYTIDYTSKLATDPGMGGIAINITVPEPSHVAVGLGLAALGSVLLRNRQRK